MSSLFLSRHVALLGAGVLLLAGCAENPQDQNAEGSGSASLTVAGGDNLGAAQFLLAEAGDEWAHHDLEVDAQSFPSGRDALNAVLGGTAEVGTIGDLPTVTAVLADEDIRILGAVTRGTDWRVLTTQSSGIADPADLEGKRIGLPQGTNAQYLLSRILDSADLKESDVEIINLSPNQVPASLEAGDIDAGITFPTYWGAAEEALGDDFDYFVFDDYQSPTLLIAGPGASEERQAQLVEALVSAESQVTEDPEGAQAAIAEASAGEISLQQVEELWGNYTIEMVLDDDVIDGLVEEAEWAVDELDMAGDPSRENFLDFIHAEPLADADPDSVTFAESD